MLFLFFFLLPSVFPATIDTPLGLLKGKEFRARDGSLVHAFRHIPFAEAPIRELRFALPVAKRPWTGVWDGTEYGPACTSNSTMTKSPQKWIDEDCLHNNVFVSDRCLRKKNCPVVFYIHGGAFQMDSAVMFGDDELINNFGANDVVLVLSAFRLGVFGLLNFGNENIIPSELPLSDILVSLMWVQDNIKAFGGDPRQVTLLGHSYGGHTVTALAFSKTLNPNKRLFHRAIAMSGVGMLSVMQEVQSQKLSWEFATRTKCVPYAIKSVPSENYLKELINCLRSKNQSDLMIVQRQMEEEGVGQDEAKTFAGLYPKGISLPTFHESLTNPSEIPLMLGSTIDEADMQKWVSDYSVALADDVGLRRPMAAGVKYHKDLDSKTLPFKSLPMSQLIYLRNFMTASAVSNSGVPVYVYSYSNPKHAQHTDDLSYIMGVHKFDQDENEKVLAKLYPKYFINFIKTGVPDPEWEPFRSKDGNYFEINVDKKTGLMPKNALHYESNVVNYWLRNMTEFDRKLVEKEKEQHGIAVRSVKFPLSLVKKVKRNKDDVIAVVERIAIALGLVLCGFLLGKYLGTSRTQKIMVVDENSYLLK